jgi:hypothetical protein
MRVAWGFFASPFDARHLMLRSSCAMRREGRGLSKAQPKFQQLVEGVDFYKEGAKVVFTSVYHLKRGYCCHSKCRHCPYGLGVAQTVRIEIQGLTNASPIVQPNDPSVPEGDG